jgi:hypothetical protein
MKLFNKKGQAAAFDNLVMIIIFLVLVSVVGLIAGILYFNMNLAETTLKSFDFTIPIQDNSTISATNMSTFQDILEVTAYPLLGLKSSLPYLTYFMIFAFILALGMFAYLSAKNPIFFVLHLLFTIAMTYFCFILSNMYIKLMTDPFINAMMIGFPIYNKIMFNLPLVVFFTSLVFGAISFINLIKPQNPATTGGIQYGGEY